MQAFIKCSLVFKFLALRLIIIQQNHLPGQDQLIRNHHVVSFRQEPPLLVLEDLGWEVMHDMSFSAEILLSSGFEFYLNGQFSQNATPLYMSANVCKDFLSTQTAGLLCASAETPDLHKLK